MAFWYPYRFVQIFPATGNTHLKDKRLYTFKSEKSHLWYWVWIEHYSLDMYAVKFHLKSHRDSPNKYNLLTNTYEPRRIIFTCIRIMLEVYEKDRNASFGFIGANLENESQKSTKRYKVYSKLMATYFSDKYFLHHENIEKSAYLLINRNVLTHNPHLLQQIQTAFIDEYPYFE